VAASFSPDNRLIVTASGDDTARIWNVETGKIEHVLRGHRNRLTAAAFSPNGRLLVTTSEDVDARLWDVATGRPLHVLRIHYGVATDAAFTADSRWVVTAGGAGAGLFSATTGQTLYLVRTRDALPLKAATSPDGWRIAIGGSDGYVETHDCQLCGGLNQLLSLARKRLAQLHATS
jgi:WD40 repeat protein